MVVERLRRWSDKTLRATLLRDVTRSLEWLGPNYQIVLSSGVKLAKQEEC